MATTGATKAATDCDVLLVGGGLANLLIAWRLHDVRPDLRIVVVEQGEVPGGNHTWSFHETDLTAVEAAWIAPLISCSWDRQEVRFPAARRMLKTGYRSIFSDDLARRMSERPAITILCGIGADEIAPDGANLSNGQKLTAPLVIDGRGPLREQPLALAYQKFVGIEIETTEPHGQSHPIIMDATVTQRDGYRFVYTLPMSPTRILIEDTYYSDGANLDAQTLDQRARAYCTERNWHLGSVIRREQGVLPITLAGDIDAHWRALGRDLPRSGLRAWLFHATTGYSLPYAVHLADRIAKAPELTSPAIAKLVEDYSREVWREQSFMRLLNRLLFIGARPDERRAVLARFYGLSEGIIERFYAGRTTTWDKARILSGRPPIPVARGLGVISSDRAWDFVARQNNQPTDLG